MIIEGNKTNPCRKCGTAANLAAHLQRTDTNEKVKIHEVRGFAFDDLENAFSEINATAAGTRASKAAYHAKINPQIGENLTAEEAIAGVDKLEKALGLEGQPRVIVEHVKEGRQHFHAVWSRIDLEKMIAIDTPNNYAIHERIAVELENDFHLTPTPTRAHERTPEQTRPEQNAEKWQYQQAERLQTKTPREQKAEITALYAAATNGKELQAALAGHGYTLARGDKEGVLLVVDERGGFASLARRVEGAKTADVRAKVSDLDLKSLPTLDQTRSLANVKEIKREIEAEPKAAEAEQAKQQTRPAGLYEALDARKFILARASGEDVATYAKLREQATADGLGKKPPELREGQVVAVSKRGSVVFLSEKTTGIPADTLKKQLKQIDPASLPDVRLAAATNKLAENIKAEEKAEVRDQHRSEQQARNDEYAKTTKSLAKLSSEMDGMHKAGRVGFKVVGCGLKVGGKAADTVAKVAEGILSLFAPPIPRKITPDELWASKEARREYAAQLEERKKEGAALDRIGNRILQDKRITYTDLVSLGRESLEELKMRGDDGLLSLIRQREKERERGRRMER